MLQACRISFPIASASAPVLRVPLSRILGLGFTGGHPYVSRCLHFKSLACYNLKHSNTHQVPRPMYGRGCMAVSELSGILCGPRTIQQGDYKRIIWGSLKSMWRVDFRQLSHVRYEAFLYIQGHFMGPSGSRIVPHACIGWWKLGGTTLFEVRGLHFRRLGKWM